MLNVTFLFFSAILIPFSVVIADLDISKGNRNEARKQEPRILDVQHKFANPVMVKHYGPDLSDDKLINLIHVLVSNHINKKKSQQLSESQEESEEIYNEDESQENNYENPLIHNYLKFLQQQITGPGNLYRQTDQENLRDEKCYGIPCRLFKHHDESSDKYRQFIKDSSYLKKLFTDKEKAKKQDGPPEKIIYKKAKKQDKKMANVIVF